MQTIITDFEKAVFFLPGKKSFLMLFIKGVRFHHHSVIWSKLGDLGLQALFHQEAKFQELTYKLYSLCYVPADEVVSTYNDVILPIVEHGLDNYQDWLDYAAELEEFG